MFKAVNLALQLKEIHHGTLDLDIKTSTINIRGMYFFLVYMIYIYIYIDRLIQF